MDRVLRVVVVDDSAYVRKVVREILSRSPFIEVVGTARDGREALDLVERTRSGRGHVRSHHAGARWRRIRTRTNAAAAGADHHHERREGDC